MRVIHPDRLAATASTNELERVAGVQRRWHEALSGIRGDAAARRLTDALPAHPVVSALTAAETLGVSRPAAANAILTLERRGILTALGAPAAGRNPRERWWVAVDLLS